MCKFAKSVGGGVNGEGGDVGGGTPVVALPPNPAPQQQQQQVNVEDGGGGEADLQISLDEALTPDNMLDVDVEQEGNGGATCLRVRVDTPLMTDYEYERFLHSVPIDTGTAIISSKHGAAIHLQTEERDFALHDYELKASRTKLNYLEDDRMAACLTSFGFGQWMSVGGILAKAFPGREALTAPIFNLMGNGSLVGLHREMYRLGTVHYLARGKERVTIIPVAKSQVLAANIQTYLSMIGGADSGALDCNQRMCHAEFFFQEDYLKNLYGATVVELSAGQALFLDCNAHYHIRTIEAGITVDYPFVPKNWLEIDPLPECIHVRTYLNRGHMLHLRSIAMKEKDYSPVFRMFEEKMALLESSFSSSSSSDDEDDIYGDSGMDE